MIAAAAISRGEPPTDPGGLFLLWWNTPVDAADWSGPAWGVVALGAVVLFFLLVVVAAIARAKREESR